MRRELREKEGRARGERRKKRNRRVFD